MSSSSFQLPLYRYYECEQSHYSSDVKFLHLLKIKVLLSALALIQSEETVLELRTVIARKETTNSLYKKTSKTFNANDQGNEWPLL